MSVSKAALGAVLVGALGLGGCATRGYVDEQIAAVSQRIDGVDTRLQASDTRLQTIEGTAN